MDTTTNDDDSIVIALIDTWIAATRKTLVKEWIDRHATERSIFVQITECIRPDWIPRITARLLIMLVDERMEHATIRRTLANQAEEFSIAEKDHWAARKRQDGLIAELRRQIDATCRARDLAIRERDQARAWSAETTSNANGTIDSEES